MPQEAPVGASWGRTISDWRLCIVAKVALEVPALWADHHVLRVRDALFSLDGVEEVYASAAWNQVLVTYSDQMTDQAALEKVLADSGFPVGEGGVPILAEPTKNRKDPAWIKALRITETNMADRDMSGDFRRY